MPLEDPKTPAGADNSTKEATWTAIGEGGQMQKSKLSREERLKLHEEQLQDKTKSQ